MTGWIRLMRVRSQHHEEGSNILIMRSLCSSQAVDQCYGRRDKVIWPATVMER